MIYLALAFVALYIYLGKYAHKCNLYLQKDKSWAVYLHSFASGLLLAAVFLKFFEKIYEHTFTLPLLVTSLASFTIFYALYIQEKHCHKKKGLEQLRKQVVKLRLVFVAIHHGLIGMLFAHLAHDSTLDLILIGIPFIVVKLASSFGYYHINSVSQENYPKIFKYLADIMVIVGFAVVYFYPHMFLDALLYAALAFVAGGVFFIVITELFAQTRVNAPYMILGELAYAALFFLPVLLHSI